MPSKPPSHRIPAHLSEFSAFLKTLRKESDRGAVLISATMIDDLLEQSIKAFLLDDKRVEKLIEGFNAPLGTLSSRVLAAFALGVLSENEYEECERLRKVRNVFAHSIHSSFDDQNLKDLCSNLKLSVPDTPEAKLDAKAKYVTAAVSLILGLTNRPHYVKQQRVTHREWSR